MTAKEFQKIVQKESEKFLLGLGDKTIKHFQANVRRRKLVKKGNLLNSFKMSQFKNGFKIISMMPYAMPVHQGTWKSGGLWQSFARKTKTGSTTVKEHHKKPTSSRQFMRPSKLFLNEIINDLEKIYTAQTG